MFCKYCGKQIPDNSRFCAYCQAPTGIQPLPQSGATQVLPPRPPQSRRAAPPKKRKRWPLAVGILALVAVLGLTLALGVRYAMKQFYAAETGCAAPLLEPTNQTTAPRPVPTTAATEPPTVPPETSLSTEPAPVSSVPASNPYYGCRSDETGFVLPDSDVRYYTQAELSNLTAAELTVARNEIFARHGYRFTNPDLLEYFSCQSWYVPRIPAEDFSAEVLNEVELANIRLIQEREASQEASAVQDNGSNPYLKYYDPNQELILPDSHQRAYTEAELQDLTKEELLLARNEIYARRGYTFQDEDLAAYFALCSWYTPTVENGHLEEIEFNEYEGYNINLIVTCEAERDP